jgi:hypothetical protein
VPKIGRDDISIAYLVKRRYPLAFATNQSTSARADQISDAEKYRLELAILPSAELALLVGKEKQKERDEAAQRLIQEEKQRFFNKPGSGAPFDHYCKLAYWTLDECVALSLGKNPEIVNWEALKPLVQVSPYAANYQRLREVVQRAKWAQQLFDPVHPTIFLSWAKKSKFPINDELLTRAVDSGISLKGWQELFEECTAKRAADFREHEEERRKSAEEFAATIAEKDQQIEALKKKLATASTSANPRTLETRERENLQLIALLGAIRGYGLFPVRT